MLRHDGSGLTGRWGTRELDTLAQWRIASFGDASSLSDDPLFVDVDGADDLLGYVSLTNDGRGDDFHVQSTIGRFAGSLAPVRSDATGLPVDVPVTAFIDAAQSPAIDRGDESMTFANEPATNGGYVNLGAYGNTAQASKSPAEFLIIVSPDGGEVWPIGRTFDITWRATQLSGEANGVVDIDLVRDGDATFVLPLATLEMSAGQFEWLVPESVMPSDDYRIRVTRSDVTGGLTDQSDAPLEIIAPISFYYVNDGVDSLDQYTTAAGDDANDGLSPATPKATLRSLLESGTLQPGDAVVIDHGVYEIDTTLMLVDDLSGVTIQGPTVSGSHAILDRNNTSSGSYIFQFAGADDVTITGLTLTGAYSGIYAHGQVDSDRIEIVGNTFADNNFSGIYAGTPNWRLLAEWNIEANTIYGSTYGVYLTQVDAVVQNNFVFNNQTGLLLDRYRDPTISLVAVDNEAYQNQTGIDVQLGAIASGNRVYHNTTGIFAGTSQGGLTSLASDNVAFDNDVGIRLRSRPSSGSHAEAIANSVFSNRVGIQADSYSWEGFLGTIKDNLVYDNQDSAIAVYKGLEGTLIVGNTVHQKTGSAISLHDKSSRLEFRNNIFSIDGGYVFEFAADSETAHSSDFNLFDLGSNGKVAKFEAGEIATLENWSYEFGLDVHSRSGESQFVDVDGTDDVLGFSKVPVAAPIIIDNGDVGFSTTGQWTHENSGYQDDSLIASTASDLAVWTFDNLTPGAAYTVATTVGDGVYRSIYDSKARFQIFIGGQLSSQNFESQRNFFSPDDFEFVDQAVGWNRLGYYFVGSDGTLRVELTGSGQVGRPHNADAIRIQQIEGLVAADDDFHLQPTSPGIDGGDPSFDVSEEPLPSGGRVNLGAYGGTPEATVSSAETLIHLIDPAGPHKFRAGTTMPIRWQSQTGSAVDILLYDAAGYAPGASVPAFVIADGLMADGVFDWQIPNVPSFPTDHNYVIEIMEVDGAMPNDLSDIPFTVAAAGYTGNQMVFGLRTLMPTCATMLFLTIQIRVSTSTLVKTTQVNPARLVTT